MSEFISGKEALIAWYEGLEIEVKHNSTGWFVFNDHNFGITVFKSEDHQFRLKPRTITINGIEVPAPNYIETDPNLHGGWAINIGTKYYMYKSKKDYDNVIAALHGALGKK